MTFSVSSAPCNARFIAAAIPLMKISDVQKAQRKAGSVVLKA
jgi:hypothetical protein